MALGTNDKQYNHQDDYWVVNLNNKHYKCATSFDAEALLSLESLIESFDNDTLAQSDIDRVSSLSSTLSRSDERFAVPRS